MTTITELRQQLDTLLADLDEREQAVDQAAEQLSQDQANAAAWLQGGLFERDRVLLLIDHQLSQLKRGGTDAVSLIILRQMVAGVEA